MKSEPNILTASRIILTALMFVPAFAGGVRFDSIADYFLSARFTRSHPRLAVSGVGLLRNGRGRWGPVSRSSATPLWRLPASALEMGRAPRASLSHAPAC